MIEQKKKIIYKRYAEAFFTAILEHDFEECFKDFEAFCAIYFGFDGLREILNHPTIHVNRKIEMLKRIFGPKAREKVVDFLCLLVKRRRINYFEGIAQEVERFYRRKNNIRGIVVKSSLPLTREQRVKLRQVLTTKFGHVEIREIVDKKIIGGLIIQFGDEVIDESLRYRLKTLRDIMIRVDNEWLATLINEPGIAI